MGNMKIRTKLLLIFMLISVVPILMLGSISFSRTQKMLRDQAMTTLISASAQLEKTFGSSVDRVNRSIGSLAYSTTLASAMTVAYTDTFMLRESLEEFIHPILILTVGQHSDYKDIKIYTSRDFYAYSYLVKDIEKSESMKERIMPAVETDGPYWHFENDTIYASQKISMLTSNKNIDIITLEINADSFYNQFLSNDSNVALYDSNGRLLFSDCSFSTDNLYNKLEDITKYGGYIYIDGEEYMAVKGMVEQPELELYTFVPVKSTVVDSDNIITTTLLFAIAMFIFSMITSFWFSQKIAIALGNIIKAFDVVESGSFDVEIENNKKDEIGELTRRFVHLMNWLRDEIDENNRAHGKVREAELRALQAQINPHFLYNALSIINWKALEYGATELSHVALTLSVFYRTALSKGEDIIPLEKEVMNVRAYIDIRLVMNNQCFDVEYDIDESVLSCKVMKLMLQPIVENSIDHGINDLEDRRGKIKITIGRDDDKLRISVSDNGKGMSEKMANDILTGQSDGYGLKNVNDRLQYYFGPNSGMKIESVEGEGTTITIDGIICEN